ncbi:MAG: hypothetical protein ACLUUO_09965 [Sellimonas intestinalis]
MIEFLGMVIIFHFLIERKKNGWKTIHVWKIVLIAAAALGVFFILFFLFGFITGKSQGESCLIWFPFSYRNVNTIS